MDRAEVLAQMVKLMWGYRASQVLRAVAELGIADLLEGGPLGAEEIADRANLIADNTFRLLRAAVAIGLVQADRHNRFYTTPQLDMLRKNAPQSLYYWAVSSTGTAHWLPWQALAEAVRSGVNPAQRTLGSDFFTYLEDNPHEGREFLDSMSAITSAWASHVSALIDTSSVSCVVDVGGANGSLLGELQRVNRELRGVIVERPRVAAKMGRLIADSEFGDRTTVVAGSYFDPLPAADLYLLKMVLRTWDSTHCIQILQRCRDAMNAGGRIVIVEQVVGSDCNPGIVAGLSDLNMLVVSQGGRERTLPQFDALLEAAGLRRIMVSSMMSPHSVIEAVAA